MHPLVAEARDLDAAARRHKRESQRHREAARDCRQRQAEVEAECRRLGIEITYHGEGETHGQTHPRHHDAH